MTAEDEDYLALEIEEDMPGRMSIAARMAYELELGRLQERFAAHLQRRARLARHTGSLEIEREFVPNLGAKLRAIRRA